MNSSPSTLYNTSTNASTHPSSSNGEAKAALHHSSSNVLTTTKKLASSSTGKKGADDDFSSSSGEWNTTAGRPGRRLGLGHLIVESVQGEWFIVSTLSMRKDTTILAVHPETGALQFAAVKGKDIFLNESEAVAYLKANYQLKNATRAEALLGYVCLQSVGAAWLVVATKVRRDMTLPGGHGVFTIMEAKWMKMDLNYLGSPNKVEARNMEVMQDFPLEGLHFYCDTFDVTRPYPSPYPVDQYCEEYVWNEWLASPFQREGLRMWCVVMLQGVALTKTIPVASHKPALHLGVLTRKSTINAGTRYYARGLNKAGGPGNESECELLMWTTTAHSDLINWRAFLWRRGTVPIWWRSEMKSVGESRVVVEAEHPFKGSDKYYARLLRRYGPHPFTICNMLRIGAMHEESTLTEFFERSLDEVKKIMPLDVKMIKFDWHHNLKQMGSQKAIETLWTLLRSSVQNVGLSCGQISLVDVRDGENADDDDGGGSEEGELHGSREYVSAAAADAHGGGGRMYFRWMKRQKGFIRFNCADSLDRTNVATFFHSWQVVAEMCRQLGVFDDKGGPTEEWGHYDLELPQLVARLPSPLLGSLTEFFVYMGDVISVLYTNSPAMHSSLMREYSPNVAAPRSNAFIAIQRRYQNVVKDSTRQLQYNMILGRKLAACFPSLEASPSRFECVSSYPAFSLKTVPCLFSDLEPEKWLLADKLTNEPFSWIAPSGCDVLELYIVLRRSCDLKEFALTVTGGAGDAAYPVYVDLFIGPYLNRLSIVMQDLPLPRVTAGTKLYYEVPAHTWTAYEGPSIYDFGDAGGKRPKTRIVQFRFRGLSSSHYMTIGKIELYGQVPQPLGSPEQAYENVIQKETHSKVKSILEALDIGKDEKRRGDAEWSSSEEEDEGEEGDDLSRTPLGGLDFKMESTQEKRSTDMVLDMFGVTPAFQGEEEDLPRSRSSSLTLASMSEVSPRNPFKNPREFTILGDRAIVREIEEKGVEEVYAETVRTLLTTKGEKALDFTDTLELEYLRLSLGLTAAQRDQILLKLHQSIFSYNPCRFVFLHDEKAQASMRRAAKHKSPSVCHNCKSSLGFFSIGVAQCYYCHQRFCSNCVGAPTKIIEFMWDKPQPVCKRCQAKLLRQAELLTNVQHEIGKQKNIMPKEEEAREELIRTLHEARPVPSVPSSNSDLPAAFSDLQARLAFASVPTAVSLADYPSACVLLDVPTRALSAPIESVLVPEHLQVSSIIREQSFASYWSAPAQQGCVEIRIALAGPSVVRSFSIVVDELGYSESDAPIVSLLAGHTISDWRNVGSWNLANFTHLLPNSKRGIPAGEYLTFELEQPEECRLLSFTLRLPGHAATSPPHYTEGYNDADNVDVDNVAAGDDRRPSLKAKEHEPDTPLGRSGERRDPEVVKASSTPARVEEKEKEKEVFLHLGRLRVYGDVLDMYKLEQREQEKKAVKRRSARLAISANDETAAALDDSALSTTTFASASPDEPSPPADLAAAAGPSPLVVSGGLMAAQAAAASATTAGTSVASFLASLPSSLSSPFTSPSPTSVLPRDLPLTGLERILYDQIMNTPSPRNYNLITPVWAQSRNGKQMIDICIEPSTVTGFVALVRHGDEGYLSQVKLIRVLAIVTGEAKGEIVSFRPVGRFVLPKARPRTYLCFEFSSSPSSSSSSSSSSSTPSSSSSTSSTTPSSCATPAPLRANILTFQFLSNYGGRETQPPKIYLFSSGASSSSSASASSSSSTTEQ